MSGDFPERDDHGLAEWLDDWQAGCEVPGQRGEPAYPANFGWTPPRIPPGLIPPPSIPLIPSPRRAPDDDVT